MMNSHSVAAAFAAVSGLLVIVDKPGWAAFLIAAVAIEAVHAIKTLQS